MNPNEHIRASAKEAWNWFHHNHAAYFQALIVVTSARDVKDHHAILYDAFTALDEFTSVLGMDQIGYFRSNLFYSQVSGLELFLQRVVRSVISGYPKKLGSVQFKLSQITDAASIDDLITQAAEDYLNRVMYKKPMEYLEEICSILSISQEKLQPLWPPFVEAKARRDVGIHNNWVCNETYIRKVSEAGITVSTQVGQSLVPHDNKYMIEATNNLRAVAEAVLFEIHDTYV